MNSGPLVRLENVGKNYGKIVSLKGITLEIGRNEIVGLIGDNGAGKSTLIKVLTGVEAPTSGTMYIHGEKIDASNYTVQDAHKLRIETVYQDSSLGEKQPLWRNFFVGRPITNWLGFIDVKAERKVAEHIMRSTIGFRGVGINVDTPVSRLSGGERQGVAIGRAMHFESDLIVLDEPTVALALKEVQKVLDFIRSIKAGGKSCIYIEHNIHHVHEVCDRLIVLDRGEIALDAPASSMTYPELSEFLLSMHGRRIGAAATDMSSAMTPRAYCDCHVNIWNDEHVLPLYGTQLSRVRQGDMAPKSDADTIFAEMSEVEKAIVFALRYGDAIGIESDDETTARAVAKYPDKIVGFAYVDPRRSDCMELLRHAVEDLGLKGVKYGPIYNGVPLSDPRLDPIYEYCQKNNIPLTMHMGTTYARNAPVDLGRAIHVEPVALKYPDLTMILAHMGHPWYGDCIAVSRKQPNVYCEVSALFYRPWQYYNILIEAQEYKIIDKIFFGTDFPFSRVGESVDGLLNINDQVAGTNLPRVSDYTKSQILNSDPFTVWWKGDNPLET